MGSQGAPRGGVHSQAAPCAAVWAVTRTLGPRGLCWESRAHPWVPGLRLPVDGSAEEPPSPALVSAHRPSCTHTHFHFCTHTLTRSHVCTLASTCSHMSVCSPTCAHSFTHTAVGRHALVHLHSHVCALAPSRAHSDACRGIDPAHAQGDKRWARPPGAPHPGTTAAPQDTHTGPHSHPALLMLWSDLDTWAEPGPGGQRGRRGWPPSSSLASQVPLSSPAWSAPMVTVGIRAFRGAATHDAQGGGRHARQCGWGGGPGRHPAAAPGQGACPRRQGRWGRLDDSALLLLEGGAVRPGQQQLLLMGQAVQQVLLAAVAVHLHEGHDREDQPGQPRGPEAELHRERRAGSGPARPSVHRTQRPP